ncbi:MAG: DUF3999 family protein, partial [Terriglobales bacterium]
MKPSFILVAIVISLAEAPTPEASIAFFSNIREVTIKAPDQQNYLLLDGQVWKHARADLGDLRLYATDREVPYVLVVESASSSVVDRTVELLDLGTFAGKTRFLLDTDGVPEYDRVMLDLTPDAKDFIAPVALEGADTHGGPWTTLGIYTLYDFSREKLGCNATLKPPLSRFRYLRATVSGLSPRQILGAHIATTQEQNAAWTELSEQPQIAEAGKTTVITWEPDENVPLERISFSIDPAYVNFRRTVEVSTVNQESKKEMVLAHGNISHVHLTRGGRSVDSESLSIAVSARASNYKVTLQNGDDQPLHITKVQPFMLERRVYFDPKGQTALRLYYGDSRLAAPTYDYAKFFNQEPTAVRADLGIDKPNPAYTGRPDDRP